MYMDSYTRMNNIENPLDERTGQPKLCPKCRKWPVIVMFHTHWVCGNCVLDLMKIEQKRELKWIEEEING